MALGFIIPALMAAGSMLRGGAKGQAQERTNHNDFLARQNQHLLSQYGIQQGATSNALAQQDQGLTSRYGIQQGATSRANEAQSAEGLQRAQLGLQAPSVRARQSLLGSMMANLQPVTIQTNERVRGSVPTISGGLTPSMIDPTTRQHGRELMNAALHAQLSGSDIPAATDFKNGILDAPAMTDFKSGILTPPELQGYKQPGKGESALSILGALLGGLDAFQGAGGLQKQDPNAYVRQAVGDVERRMFG